MKNKVKKEKLNIGTQNAKETCGPGKLKELIEEVKKYNLELLAQHWEQDI